MAKYQPISCDLYSTLELFALRRSPGKLLIRNSATAQTELVETTIEDLFSRDKVEYARLGNGITIRLDQLLELNGLPISDC